MKHNKCYLVISAVVLTFALSACSNNNNASTNTAATEPPAAGAVTAAPAASPEATTSPVVEGGATAAPQVTAAPEASTAAENSAEPGSSGTAERPEYLPEDFPLPEDSKIETSNSGLSEDKKYAMLIYTTEQDMAAVTKLYKDYFKAKNLSDAGQTIDDKNLIIQGVDEQNKQSWSLIGGVMASSEHKVIELTLTWMEM
ncbi:hypothetical protein B9T62_10425 [Paenibacillus donghaensis]|uniref:Uncharacterized protein n=2 Tax=Paenibacillus donghaensis TaxID=414771 RepID=A0A2Z2KBT1_9BACL|nr:hypothetical protein B9T62_10425 [Paenibacillus donghaensis]